jgi:hypothetical protein
MGETPAEISVYKRKNQVVRLVIVSGWAITLLATFGLVGAAVALMLMNLPVPTELKQWAGISIGFLFGTFSALVRDYVLEENS